MGKFGVPKEDIVSGFLYIVMLVQYLLQQWAELPRKGKQQVDIIGLLHQSVADYGDRLASNERKEWPKIQGCFEDIFFTESESSEQMTRLIDQATNRENSIPVNCAVYQQSQE